MKKRLLALLLTVVMLISMAPVAMADYGAEKTITDYELWLGTKNSYFNGNEEVTEYFPYSYEKGIIDDDTVTTFDYYLVLYDNDSQTEAPESVYNELINNYEISVSAYRSPENVTVSELKTEGYHKYVTVTVVGEWDGVMDVVARTDGHTFDSGMSVTIAQATKLVLDQNETSAFSVADAEPYKPYFFYVETDNKRSYKVSGSIDSENALGVLNQEYTLWARWDLEENASTYTQNISGKDYIVFTVENWADDSCDISGHVTVEAEKPKLKYRHTGSSSPYLNDEISLSPGYQSHIDVCFVDGVTQEWISPDELSSSDESVMTVTKRNDGVSVAVKAVGFGTAYVVYEKDGTEYKLPVVVDIPDFGYYKTSTASQESYIGLNTAFNFTGENDILYFLAKTGDDNTRIISNLILREDFAKVAKAEKVTDTCWEITFTGIPAGWYAADANHTKNSSTRTNQYSINFNDARPGLKLREMAWDNDGCYEDTSRPMKSTWENAKGYMDTIKFYIMENGVATPIALKNLHVEGDAVAFYQSGEFIEIEAVEFGTSTVSYSANGKTYSIEFNVTLPNIGAYIGPERTEENFMYGIDLAKAENGVVWLIKDGGFTGNMSMTLDGEPFDDFEIVERDDGNYDVKLDFSNVDVSDYMYLQITYGPNNNRHGFSVQYEVRGNAVYVGDYAIGFAWDDEDTGITTINEGNWMIGNGGSVVFDTYEPFRELKIAAGIKKTDEQGNAYYDVVTKDNKIDFEITKVWIEEVKGEEDVFSLVPGSLVEEKTDYTEDDVSVYAKIGHDSTIYLKAELKVTVGKETTTETISTGCFTYYVPTFYEERPADDTVEKLNAYFEEISDDVVDGAMYTVVLAPIEYTGTIVLPEAFRANNGDSELFIQGSVDEEGNATIIRGGIDFNGATVSMISDVHFKGDSTYTKGIYNGALLNMYFCSFEGYDIAIDGSGGMVTLSKGNVFVDNDTAVYLDIANAQNVESNRNPWTNNTFINNGTAIHIVSLSEFISAYYFRVVNSNFIGNEKAFVVDENATLYMYNNYYGRVHDQASNLSTNSLMHALAAATTDTKLNNVVSSYPSKSGNVTCASGSEVILNPHWKKPVLGWWTSQASIGTIFPNEAPVMLRFSREATYDNQLVVDWTQKTEIINKEADGLVIDAAAFNAENSKQIDVVDDNGTRIGTWNFENSAADFVADADGFNAGIGIVKDGENQMNVTVKDGSVLADMRPTLTIPCNYIYAKVTAPDGTVENCTIVDGNVTFTVFMSGTYTIEKIDSIADEFAGGTGTAEDPYLIDSAEHLNNVRNHLDAHFKMTDDIVFTDADFAEGGAFYNDGAGWTPIGDDLTNKFTGVFDGDGHTITGLYQNITASSYVFGGLFGHVGGATIKNLGMVDSDITVKTTLTGNAFAGGIVSYAYSATITNCDNTGTVSANASGNAYAGGIAGYIHNDSTISNCYNTGAVSANASGNVEAGGIVGCVHNGSTISNCYNTGKIDGRYAGGIAGYVESSTITNCYNTGAVTSNASSETCTGGIVGYVHNGSTISNCYNTGTVSGSSAGGIVGSVNSATITNCYNIGAVSADSFSGGIVGEAEGINISNCYNTGALSGKSVGGIIGNVRTGTATVTNCYNIGEIKAADSAQCYAGGIVGYVWGMNPPTVEISGCYNMGALSAVASNTNEQSSSGGIVGYFSSGTLTISDCYNGGAVKAQGDNAALAGGVVGRMYNATVSISRFYNIGTVNAAGALPLVGGIVGCIDSCNITITSCYHMSTKGVGSGTDAGTKCTSTQMKKQETFAGFDFTKVWTMGGNTGYKYPELRDVPYTGNDTIITGTALSWNNTDDAVYVLYASTVTDDAIKAEWAAGSYSGTVCTEKGASTAVTVDGKSMYGQTFSFFGVSNGSYKLAIFKPGKYVPKIIEVTVSGSSVNLGQQKLWLYGDVNYDGKIRAGDATQVLQYIAKTRELTEEQIAAADVTRDGKIRAGDATQIKRYIAKMESSFNSMK